MKYYAVVDTNVLVSSLILKKDDTATIANNLSYDLIEKLCGLLEEQVIELNFGPFFLIQING